MKYQIFGESHGPAIGVVLEGLPSGLLLDTEEISRQMDRRRAKRTACLPAASRGTSRSS